MAEAPDIPTAWRDLLEQTPGTRQGNLLVARAAHEQCVLRGLFPFPTHGTLHFLVSPPPPWPADLGEPELLFMTESGPPFRVYTARYGELLGEADTPEAAAAQVVANLPPLRPGTSLINAEEAEAGFFVELSMTQFGPVIVRLEQVVPRVNGVKLTGRTAAGLLYNTGAKYGSRPVRTRGFC